MRWLDIGRKTIRLNQSRIGMTYVYVRRYLRPKHFNYTIKLNYLLCDIDIRFEHKKKYTYKVNCIIVITYHFEK